MFRLHTTAALSVFALVIGIAGTAALSERTGSWTGPTKGVARGGSKSLPAQAVIASATRKQRRVAQTMQKPAPSHWLPPPHTRDVDGAASINAMAEPAQLRPLSMPANPTPYMQLLGHLDGQMLLRLDVDGAGRVRAIAVRQSSGDAVLDAYAVRMVRGWRFAVPAGHPAGLDGELPLRFDRAGANLPLQDAFAARAEGSD